MKTLFTLLFCAGLLISGYAQPTPEVEFTITFDGNITKGDVPALNHLYMDTVDNPQNSWQIGTPQKNTFTSARSAPYAIVTDTVNPYPINDTSSFIVRQHKGGLDVNNDRLSLSGSYLIDSDTLRDIGQIDISFDTASTWQTLYTFSGSSGGEWKYFNIDVNLWDLPTEIADPTSMVLWRFSFMSDSIQTNRDGLMFDDLFFDGLYFWGIDEQTNKSILQTTHFPNPTKNNITVELENTTPEILTLSIFNKQGKEIYKQTTEQTQTINVQDFPAGIYLYTLTNSAGKVYASDSFTKI